MNRMCSGIGAIAFALLTIATFAVGNPPGGDYSKSDVTDYLASGHQLAVFVSLYLGLLSAIGLLVLVAGLSSAVENEGLRRLFWGSGIAATAACATGWCVVAAPAAALTFGSSARPIDPKLAYVLIEAGFVFIFGAGCVLLGTALLVLVAASRRTLPTWVRWTTAVGALAALASLAFFPSFLVPVWAVVIGIWLLTRPARTVSQAAVRAYPAG
jgi:hypothetical protein